MSEVQEVVARGMYEKCAALIPEFDLRHVPLGSLLQVIEQSKSLLIVSEGSFHVRMLTPWLLKRNKVLLRRVNLLAIQVPSDDNIQHLERPQDLINFSESVKARYGHSDSQILSLEVTAKFQNISNVEQVFPLSEEFVHTNYISGASILKIANFCVSHDMEMRRRSPLIESLSFLLKLPIRHQSSFFQRSQASDSPVASSLAACT